jgi:small-conductance mechanosensitive channel
VVRSTSDTAGRVKGALRGIWRLLIGIGAIYVIARLWGLDLWALAKGEGAPGWASMAFDISVTLLFGHILWRLIRAALRTETRAAAGGEDVDPSSIPAASRLDTLIPLSRNVLLAFIAIVVAMIVLASLGLNIGPLIASAGIVGIAIGFGAQTLVRDIFSGVFFLVDDAFRIGEYIELDSSLRGEIEAISIRSLQLRHHRGAVITIPFGELKQITNHNRDWVIYKMQFRMEPETDPEAFRKVVKKVGQELAAHPEHGPKLIEPLKSQGVYFVDDDSALVMRVKFKCRPRAQFVLRREVYHRLRAAFAENGLGIARRKVEVVGPAAATAAAAEETLQPPAAAAE